MKRRILARRAPPTNNTEEVLSIHERFRKFAYGASCCVGSPIAFLASLALIATWAASGPLFHFSDTWQLVINTATTIVTFLMVFLIQNTQNRDAKAIHLKLDELIRSIKGARNGMVALESLSDEELARLEVQFKTIRERSNRNKDASNNRPQGDAVSQPG